MESLAFPFSISVLVLSILSSPSWRVARFGTESPGPFGVTHHWDNSMRGNPSCALGRLASRPHSPYCVWRHAFSLSSLAVWLDTCSSPSKGPPLYTFLPSEVGIRAHVNYDTHGKVPDAVGKHCGRAS